MRLLLVSLLLPVTCWALSPARSPECDANPGSKACEELREQNRRSLAHWNCMNELASDKMDSEKVKICAERRLNGETEDKKPATEKEYWK